MLLPSHVLQCIHTLEDASFPTYAVGGCVRDDLLGLAPHDFDLCTAATPAQMQAVFASRPLVLAGLKHGTVGVIFPEGVVEITTFRREGTYADGRHPDWVCFVEDVEEDLARRDFTVNAMAYSPSRGFADPFGGREDLKNHVLRAVGDPERRFREDALRILRGVRFSATYHLEPEECTLNAMLRLAPLMENLARERVYDELCKLLLAADVADLRRFAPIITQIIPELAKTVDFDQHSPHHAYDLYTHIAHVTAAVPKTPVLRWAALLHDVGKVATFTTDATGRGHFYGHAQESARQADEILLRLKAPTALRRRAVELIGLHMTRLEPDGKFLRRFLSRHGEELTAQLFSLQQADMGAKGTGNWEELEQFNRISTLLDQIRQENACLGLKDLAVNGHDLLSLGIPAGKPLGQCLNFLLAQVLDERLPNEAGALLAAAQTYFSKYQEEHT